MRNKKVPMNYKLYERTIAELGLNQIEAADLLEVDRRTSRRWVAPPEVPTHRIVPNSVMVILQFLLDGVITREQLKETQNRLRRRMAQLRGRS